MDDVFPITIRSIFPILPIWGVYMALTLFSSLTLVDFLLLLIFIVNQTTCYLEVFHYYEPMLASDGFISCMVMMSTFIRPIYGKFDFYSTNPQIFMTLLAWLVSENIHDNIKRRHPALISAFPMLGVAYSIPRALFIINIYRAFFNISL